jgi:hypothetical protein
VDSRNCLLKYNKIMIVSKLSIQAVAVTFGEKILPRIHTNSGVATTLERPQWLKHMGPRKPNELSELGIFLFFASPSVTPFQARLCQPFLLGGIVVTASGIVVVGWIAVLLSWR